MIASLLKAIVAGIVALLIVIGIGLTQREIDIQNATYVAALTSMSLFIFYEWRRRHNFKG